MRYTGEQDEYILLLRETLGPRWKRIAKQMSQRFQETFTDSCVRNRHQRIMKGQRHVNAGMAKNICGKCGKFLLGHICKPSSCQFTPTRIQADKMEKTQPPNFIRKEGNRVRTIHLDPEYVYGDKWYEQEEEEEEEKEEDEVTLFSAFVFGL